jgi:hypothetical protein
MVARRYRSWTPNLTFNSILTQYWLSAVMGTGIEGQWMLREFGDDAQVGLSLEMIPKGDPTIITIPFTAMRSGRITCL